MILFVHNFTKTAAYTKSILRFCSGNVQKLKPPWNVLFFGTDEFSVFSLQALNEEYRKRSLLHKLEVVTSFKGKTNPVRKFATREDLIMHEWPLSQVHDSFQVGFVVSFGYLIPEHIINAFPLGILNVHASLLPRWRGAAPIIHAIAKGDRKTGVTIMRIQPEKFDVGEIIIQEEVEIPENVTLPTLYSQLGELGAEMLVKSLNALPDILTSVKPQPNEGVTHAPRVNQNFANVDWQNMTAKEIYNLGRALTGLYPLSTTWNGSPIKLYNLKLCEGSKIQAQFPGMTIYDRNNKHLKICCKDGNWVSVEHIGVHHKKIMSASDFNNGYISKLEENLRLFQ